MLHILLAALLASGSVDARPQNDGAPPATDESPSSPELARARWRDAHWDAGARWDDMSVQDDRDLGADDVDPDPSFRFDVPALVRDDPHDARVFPRPSRDGYDNDGYDHHGYDYDGYDHHGYDRDGYDRDGYGPPRVRLRRVRRRRVRPRRVRPPRVRR